MDDRSPEEVRADDEKARHKEVAQGNLAANIVESEVFRAAVKEVRDDLYREFSTSELHDNDTRLHARIGIDVLERIVGILTHKVTTGNMARAQLADMDKPKH